MTPRDFIKRLQSLESKKAGTLNGFLLQTVDIPDENHSTPGTRFAPAASSLDALIPQKSRAFPFQSILFHLPINSSRHPLGSCFFS
jgi:hypothetical protein